MQSTSRPPESAGRSDAERLYSALELVTGMLDHCASPAVSAAWARRYPHQYKYAGSLIRRSRLLLRELERHKLPAERGA